MRVNDRKEKQREIASENIDFYISLLEKRFKPELDHLYIGEIMKFSQAFNIRLSKEQKIKFCKRCKVYWNTQSREIRLNSELGCKEYICNTCGLVRRFRYK